MFSFWHGELGSWALIFLSQVSGMLHRVDDGVQTGSAAVASHRPASSSQGVGPLVSLLWKSLAECSRPDENRAAADIQKEEVVEFLNLLSQMPCSVRVNSGHRESREPYQCSVGRSGGQSQAAGRGASVWRRSCWLPTPNTSAQAAPLGRWDGFPAKASLSHLAPGPLCGYIFQLKFWNLSAFAILCFWAWGWLLLKPPRLGKNLFLPFFPTLKKQLGEWGSE